MIAMKAVHLGKGWDAHVSDGKVFGHGNADTWADAFDQAIEDYNQRRETLKTRANADHVS